MMKTLDFSPRPGGPKPQAAPYVPGTDLATYGFSEQFVVWATRAAQMGLDKGAAHFRLSSAFAAVDAPDALPLLQQFLGLLEIEFGRPLAAPCFKWRALMADEARVLSLIALFQRCATGDATASLPNLPMPLLQTGQRLALTLSATGLLLQPSNQASKTGCWPDAMPVLH